MEQKDFNKVKLQQSTLRALILNIENKINPFYNTYTQNDLRNLVKSLRQGEVVVLFDSSEQTFRIFIVESVTNDSIDLQEIKEKIEEGEYIEGEDEDDINYRVPTISYPLNKVVTFHLSDLFKVYHSTRDDRDTFGQKIKYTNLLIPIDVTTNNDEVQFNKGFSKPYDYLIKRINDANGFVPGSRLSRISTRFLRSFRPPSTAGRRRRSKTRKIKR